MSKTIKNLIKQARSFSDEGQYAAALHTVDRLEAQLIERDDEQEAHWLTAYEIRFARSLAAGERDVALNIARVVAEKVRGFNAAAVALRRATFFLLAQEGFEKAVDEATVLKAVAYIDDAVGIASVEEVAGSVNVGLPYLETRAAIYVRAMQLSDAYRKQHLYDVMRALSAVEENAIVVEHGLVKEALHGELYRKYKKGEPLFEGMSAPVGETWRQALQRFDDAMKEMGLYEREYEGELIPHFQVQKPQRDEYAVLDVEVFEKRLNISLPESLKAFYKERGSVSVGERFGSFFGFLPLETLRRQSDRSSSQAPKDFIGLATMISMLGEGDESYLKEDLEPEVYAELNARYKVFGCYEKSQGFDQYFCFFDEQGRFGEQGFIHDNYDAWWGDLYKKDKATLLSFDALASLWVDRAIKGLVSE